MKTGLLIERVIVRKIQNAIRWRRGTAAYNASLYRSQLRGPLTVQLQTVNQCNAACIMCPYSRTRHGGEKRPMDDRLFWHVIQEVKQAGTVKTLMLMLQNEPLLDLSLEQRVQTARNILGDGVRIATVTNGSLLDEERSEKLLRSGIDHIGVSIDACKKETYEKIRKGLSFEKVRQNTRELVNRARTGNASVGVKFLRQHANDGEEKRFAAYWRQKGAAVSMETLTNRAGTLDRFETLKSGRPGLWRRFLHRVLNRLVPCCPLPFSSLSILADGRAILCCHDWEHRDAVGDISTQRLEEIWNGAKINHYRKLLWQKRASESLVCQDCSLSQQFWGG